ncbi:MAG: hypothetical protein LAP85_02700 [Acidobacteriia bacterium]|nr:hypothetical protein [Terriglobia bacterium]
MNSGQNYTLTDLPPSADLSCAASSLIYDWFHNQFPAWELDLNPKLLRSSQSLMSAPIPESARGPAGMIHFKSILDPLWTAGDLASLRDEFPWILLVLSPFERFYEVDPLLDDLSVGSTRLVIWHPDRPTAEESARLRVTSLVTPAVASESGIRDGGSGFAGKGARQILSSLYVLRGSLIVQGVHHSLHQELGDLSLQQYISACLTCLASAIPARSQAPPKEAERLALRWAALLCGQESLSGLSLYAGESQTLAWAATHLDIEPGMLSGGLQPLPEPFLTTRFRDETKAFDAAMERINHVFQCLREGDMAFIPAMTQVSQTFNGDEARLLRWKGLAEDLPKFLRWLSAFEGTYAYLSGTFPTPVLELENAKKMLLATCAEPQRFLDPAERELFDRRFDEFKREYVEYYASTHEDTVHIVGDQERMKAKVDSVALRNLELLSDLHDADKSYLNRVRAIGKFVQANQCDLPVREILARQPRCYCSFNPVGSRLLAMSVDQMNEAIREGIDHFRSLLRKHRMLIIKELKTLHTDDYHSRQIGALLSRGPMIPLKPQSIDILNTIMRQHADENRPPASDLQEEPGVRSQESD